MPLESGNSDAVISRNIKELMETGKYTHDQCIAIAYKKAGRSQTLAKALIEEPGVAVSQARAQLELDTQASNNAILFVVTKRGNVAGNGGNSQGQTDPNPTVDEKISGEYSKRVVGWQGLNISIENEVGSYREGVNRDGQKWRQHMPYAYGYINQTAGIDDDCVDVFLGPDMDSADYVYIVDARKVNRWDEFDEQKVMLGFKTEQDAKQAFLDSYTDPRFLGPVTEMLVGEFVDKVRNTKDRPTMIKAALFFSKAEFKESEHPRAENGEFSSSNHMELNVRGRDGSLTKITITGSKRDLLQLIEARLTTRIGESSFKDGQIRASMSKDDLGKVRRYMEAKKTYNQSQKELEPNSSDKQGEHPEKHGRYIELYSTAQRLGLKHGTPWKATGMQVDKESLPPEFEDEMVVYAYKNDKTLPPKTEDEMSSHIRQTHPMGARMSADQRSVQLDDGSSWEWNEQSKKWINTK